MGLIFFFVEKVIVPELDVPVNNSDSESDPGKSITIAVIGFVCKSFLF